LCQWSLLFSETDQVTKQAFTLACRSSPKVFGGAGREGGRVMEKTELSAQFIFTESGYLKAVLLNAGSDKDQITLERSLNRLFKPDHLSWVRRLFAR